VVPNANVAATIVVGEVIPRPGEGSNPRGTAFGDRLPPSTCVESRDAWHLKETGREERADWSRAQREHTPRRQAACVLEPK
jgi:hypothetical protein